MSVHHHSQKPGPNYKVISLISGIIIVIIASFSIIRYYFLEQQYEHTQNELLATENYYKGRLKDLQDKIASSTDENLKLATNLSDEQSKNDMFAQQISGISSTVNTLIKLSNTDKELLAKYSKVYFLNENYVPRNLTYIDQKYRYDKNKPLQFHTNAMLFLYRMLEDAASTDSIQIASAYRSFDTQEDLKTSYKVTYGAGTANKFSADQGYSEHQLGTAIDVITQSMKGSLTTTFEKTPAFKWLTDNAYRYGFILSYPKGNTYYQYEPWHWRFVGVALATRLHNENKHFYDLDQRDIDTYLVNIFD
jgi:D-alanyl-D-alanine carboxypeptidase